MWSLMVFLLRRYFAETPPWTKRCPAFWVLFEGFFFIKLWVVVGELVAEKCACVRIDIRQSTMYGALESL